MSKLDKVGYGIIACGLLPIAALVTTWWMPEGLPRDLLGMVVVFGLALWFLAFAVFLLVLRRTY